MLQCDNSPTYGAAAWMPRLVVLAAAPGNDAIDRQHRRFDAVELIRHRPVDRGAIVATMRFPNRLDE